MISVVIPVYRVEKYISACIQSILRQTYRDFEVILVDDGSPDRSAQIAEDMLRSDHSISYRTIRTENRGVSAARNTGVSHARGEYVIMVDSDDVLSPVFLQEYANMMERQPGLNMYSCGFSVVKEDGADIFAPMVTGHRLFTWDEAQIMFFERKIRFLLPALLFSRKFLEDNAIRFDEAVRYSEDVQFIWRCLAYNRKPVLHSTKRLYNYILHPGSTMTSSSIPKILTCCGGIERLFAQTEALFCPAIREQLVARAYFSMLHGVAKMMALESFCQLYARAQCVPHIWSQMKNGNLRIRCVAAVLLISRAMGYRIMRKY